MAAKLVEMKDMLENNLKDSSKPWTAPLEMLEKKTGVPRMYIFGGLLAVVIIYLAFGYAAQILCNLIGVVYPAYISMKAIESSTKADDTKWLTYWVSYAVLSCLEYVAFLTNLIPFYWLIKCIFLIWCMLPIERNGSTVLYETVIRPRFLTHEKTTDDALDKITGKAKELMDNVLKKAK